MQILLWKPQTWPKPDPAASVHRDAGPSQRIQAERSHPAARLSVTQRFVAKRSKKTGPQHAGLFGFPMFIPTLVQLFSPLS